MPRKASAKSLEYTSIFYFTRSNFINLLKNFHYDYEKFCYVKDRINLYENYTDLQVSCLSCRSHTHLTKECQMITYKKPLFIHSKEENNGAAKTGFIRNDRYRFNARMSRQEIEAKSESFYQENHALFEIDSPQINNETPLLQNSNTSKLRKSGTFSALIENNDKLSEKGEKKEHEEKPSEMMKYNGTKQLPSCDTMEFKKVEFDKLTFMMMFEKMKVYDLYFPHNNYNFVIKKMKVKDG